MVPQDTGSGLVASVLSSDGAAAFPSRAGRSSAWPTVQVRFSVGRLTGSQKGTKGGVVTTGVRSLMP